MAQAVSRPVGITLLMIYGFIVGVLNIAGGIFVILDRHNVDLIRESLMSPNQLLTAGIVAIIFGAIQVLLAAALGQANNLVRIVYAVVATINLAVGFWAMIALVGEQRAAGVVSVVFSGLVLYFLFNHKADEYFEAGETPVKK